MFRWNCEADWLQEVVQKSDGAYYSRALPVSVGSFLYLVIVCSGPVSNGGINFILSFTVGTHPICLSQASVSSAYRPSVLGRARKCGHIRALFNQRNSGTLLFIRHAKPFWLVFS